MNGIQEIGRLFLGVGLETHDMAVWQMALRAVVVYRVTLLIVRMAKKRLLAVHFELEKTIARGVWQLLYHGS